MSVNKFKVGDVVKCIDAGVFNNLTTGKDYVLLDVSDDGILKVENDKGSCFYYYSYRFELSKGDETSQPQYKTPKFKEGDVVKCIDNEGFVDRLTIGKEYLVREADSVNIIIINDDMNNDAIYLSSRFELSNGDETSQPPKFKEGDMVYLIGFNHFKPCKLLSTGGDYLTMKFKVMVDDSNFETFTESGCYTTKDFEPSIVLATEENRLMLNKLLGVEYEPLKLTGSDLAKKLLKTHQQICRVSNISDDYASSNNCFDLIAKFECGSFISKSGVGWKYAVPCDKHGEVLDDE